MSNRPEQWFGNTVWSFPTCCITEDPLLFNMDLHWCHFVIYYCWTSACQCPCKVFLPRRKLRFTRLTIVICLMNEVLRTERLRWKWNTQTIPIALLLCTTTSFEWSIPLRPFFEQTEAVTRWMYTSKERRNRMTARAQNEVHRIDAMIEMDGSEDDVVTRSPASVLKLFRDDRWRRRQEEVVTALRHQIVWNRNRCFPITENP